MEPQGYLHNKLDVKVLILFILARIDTPLTSQEIYEVAYQDESLNYFTFAESLPELVDSGHLQVDDHQRYAITDKGRQQGAFVEDSLAVPVVQKVSAAISEKLTQLRRDGYITTSVTQDEQGYWIATLHYKDDGMPMMTLSMMAPNEALGHSMAANLRRQADLLYKTNLDIAIAQNKKRSEQP
jgi:predicted transcriptional regulator